jgi:hypothetical protein
MNDQRTIPQLAMNVKYVTLSNSQRISSLMAAMTLVFVVMLILTILHP